MKHHNISLIFPLFILSILSFHPLQAETKIPAVRIKTADHVNVYSEPHGRGQRVGVIHKGYTYPVKESALCYVKVLLPNGKTGWVYTNPQSPWSSEDNGFVTFSKAVNVRKATTSSSQKVGVVLKGKPYKIVGRYHGYYHIEMPGDITGWVYAGSNERPYVWPHADQKRREQISQAEEVVKIVNVGALHAYENAFSRGKKVGAVYKHYAYPVVAKTTSHVKVALKNGKTGWVYVNPKKSQKISQIESQAESQVKSQVKSWMKESQGMARFSHAINVRENTDASSEKIGVVEQGHSYKIIDRHVSYYNVQLPEGKTGWIYAGTNRYPYARSLSPSQID